MIATVCDEGEFLFRVTRPAIRSAAAQMPDHPFCLVLINGSGRHDEEIRRWHPRLVLRHHALEIRPEHLRGYQFCYMTLPLHDLLCEFDEPLVYLDADTLMRGRLDPVFAMLKQYDVVMRYLPFQAVAGPTTEHDGARVNNGCLGLANNAATKKYTAELRRRVIDYLDSGRDPAFTEPTRGVATGLDQELLWVIYREMRNELRFFPLDDRFNDSQMHDDSVIWHAKGVARRHPRYVFEVARLDGNVKAMLRNWPRKLAMDAFRRVRTWKWRRNLRSAFRIEGLERRIASAGRGRLLVVNSCFLRYNPALSAFATIDCVDVDPVWYYRNRSSLDARPNVRHVFLMPDDGMPEGPFDLVVSDRNVASLRAKVMVQQSPKAPEALTWPRTRLVGRPEISRSEQVRLGEKPIGVTL